MPRFISIRFNTDAKSLVSNTLAGAAIVSFVSFGALFGICLFAVILQLLALKRIAKNPFGIAS